MSKASSSAFRVSTELVRRGSDGSLAAYLIETKGPWTRCVEVPVETLTDADVDAVVQRILTDVVRDLGPQLHRAVRAAQGGASPLPVGVTVQ